MTTSQELSAEKSTPVPRQKPPVPEPELIAGKAGNQKTVEPVNPGILEEKEQTIQELRETIDIMELKINKLEQLIRLKDSKIQSLTDKLAKAGIQS